LYNKDRKGKEEQAVKPLRYKLPCKKQETPARFRTEVFGARGGSRTQPEIHKLVEAQWKARLHIAMCDILCDIPRARFPPH